MPIELSRIFHGLENVASLFGEGSKSTCLWLQMVSEHDVLKLPEATAEEQHCDMKLRSKVVYVTLWTINASRANTCRATHV